MNICVVCSGNICRSPFVEHILKRELKDHEIYSAGTLEIEGSAAYRECVFLAPDYRINLRSHYSNALTSDVVYRSDLLVGMEWKHCRRCIELGAKENQVALLGDYLPAGRFFDLGQFGGIGQGDDIPDPMGCLAHDVKPVLDVLEIAAVALAEKILNGTLFPLS